MLHAPLETDTIILDWGVSGLCTVFGIAYRKPGNESKGIGRAPIWTWKCPNCYYENYGVHSR